MNDKTRPPTHSQARISFLVFGLEKYDVGFTDLMMRWSCLYKLGTSLGYQYVHVPLNCKFSPRIFEFLGFNDAFLTKIDVLLGLQFFGRRMAYNYMNFDYSLLSSSHPIKVFIQKTTRKIIESLLFNKYKFVDIPLSEKTLEKYSIDTCDKLQEFLKKIINKRATNTNKVIILRLQLAGGRKRIYALINSKILDFPDGLNLRLSYYKVRQKRILESKSENKKIKILVHIRQGDTAIIETPWDSFIPVYGSKSFVELSSPHDGAYADLIDIEEYYSFVQKLITYFDRDIFSFVVSSDSYDKAFALLRENLDKLEFTSNQIEDLKEVESKYRKKYDLFKLLEKCELLIGENDENLFSLIDALFESDIVIIGFRNTLGMLLKLISIYYDISNPPLIIELFKIRKPFNHEVLLGLDSKKAKVIPVQLDNIDWNTLIDQVGQKICSKLTN
jgi:molybdopterin converting factor small subunit